MNSEGRTRVILESAARSNESNEFTSFKKYNSCVSFEMTSFFIRQNFTGVARKEGGKETSPSAVRHRRRQIKIII